jgi:hypothetical protein
MNPVRYKKTLRPWECTLHLKEFKPVTGYFKS